MSTPLQTIATFLGTGTSVGVPVIGCDCPVCASNHQRNIRTRCSLHLQTPKVSVLIDTSPDLREQALRENLRTVDAVLYTHAHLDHVAGFDELRAFCWHRDDPLPLHAGPETVDSLRRMFPWAMENRQRSYVRPDVHLIDGPFEIADVTVTPFPVVHASVETFGFRFTLPGEQSLAYVSDVKVIPDSSLDLLLDLDVLVIDALRPESHPTHMAIEESLAIAKSLKPTLTVFTHLAHEIDYESVTAQLPTGVSLAYDGLKLLFVPESPCAMVPPLPPAPR